MTVSYRFYDACDDDKRASRILSLPNNFVYKVGVCTHTKKKITIHMIGEMLFMAFQVGGKEKKLGS